MKGTEERAEREGVSWRYRARGGEYWHYRWHTGYVAWLLHRVTGLLITLYLIFHVWTLLSMAQGRAAFDRVMEAVQQPPFIAGEILLLALLIFHAVNGLRICLIDFGSGSLAHRKLFWLFLLLGLLLFLMGAYPLLELFTLKFPG